MKYGGWLGVLVGLLPAVGAAPARAQSGATATRLSIEGQAARYYPTYGRVTDAELYAPLREELAALGLQFRITPTTAAASLNGKPVATWGVVRTLEALPKTGQPATVLLLGT